MNRCFSGKDSFSTGGSKGLFQAIAVQRILIELISPQRCRFRLLMAASLATEGTSCRR
jgi:hypothetical protein